ncbi:hypothetical protein DSO57_1027732 [Entomophthora muscae]|uniref:Uncharacterized protein n=1 Tax=Entomophthora muscae TaxID=34485 RepID=A0ACC2TCJ6_9FUNG|nr:hypothetical protein DSO57_1027732 [Entomophthora muscae]
MHIRPSQLGARLDHDFYEPWAHFPHVHTYLCSMFQRDSGFMLTVGVFKPKKKYVVGMHSTLFTSILLLASSLDLVIGTPLPRTKAGSNKRKPNSSTPARQYKPSNHKLPVNSSNRSIGPNHQPKLYNPKSQVNPSRSAGTKNQPKSTIPRPRVKPPNCLCSPGFQCCHQEKRKKPKNQIVTEIKNEAKNKATEVGQNVVNQAGDLVTQTIGSSKDYLLSKLRNKLNQGQPDQEEYNPTYQDSDAQSEQEADESDTTSTDEGSKTELPQENNEEENDSTLKDGTYEEIEPTEQDSDDQSEQVAAESDTTPTDEGSNTESPQETAEEANDSPSVDE